MKNYSITPEQDGSWEYRSGDIVGIDNRVWIPSGEEYFIVRNLKTGKRYKKRFESRVAAEKEIARRKKQ